MDRKKAPDINKIVSLDIPSPEEVYQVNGIPVRVVPNPKEEWTSVEMIFEAGTSEEVVPLSATTCSGLITEGTGKFTADRIAELKDFYGAKIFASIGKDSASLNLLCLNHHLEELLPVFVSIVTDPIFPEKEYHSHVKRAKAALLINLQRVEMKARIEFSKRYFGQTKYADNFSPDDYEKLTRQDVVSFFKNQYGTNRANLIVAGGRVEKAINLLQSTGIPRTEKLESKEFSDFSPRLGLHHVSEKTALQSAIRMGRSGISREHPDFVALYVANTILGGYFGSRLMQNLREDKGFTYGVGSFLQILRDHSLLVIATQVGSEHTEKAISEIDKELTRLRSQLVSSDELELVVNYIAGTLAKKLDGTANRASVVKTMVLQGLKPEYYNAFLESLYRVDGEQIKAVAEKYLQSDDFTKVVVGGVLPTTN